MPPRAAPRSGGFTLIEIIVVVLVFSIMAAMAYGGLNSVLRTRQGIERSMERTAEMQRAFQRLRADFQNLRDRPSRDEYGDARPALVASAEGAVSLIRGGWRNPMGAGRASLERLAYGLKDHQLQRSSWRVLDLARDTKPTEGVVLDQVDEIRWRFMDGAGEWQTSWPQGDVQAAGAAGTESPPVAVELTLVTKDWGELKWLFRTPVAALAPALSPSARSAGQAAGGGGGEEGEEGSLLTQNGLIESNLVVKGRAEPASSKSEGGGRRGPSTGNETDGEEEEIDPGNGNPPEEEENPNDGGENGGGDE